MTVCSATREGNAPTYAVPRREFTHEGKDHPRGDRGTVNHTPTNTTARPRMEVAPVKGEGRVGKQTDVAERPPERDVHHCAPRSIVRPT